MAEYWKSQPRKFCPQCKCWIADNKISREFHEGGKKHKEAVAIQLKEARKRGAAVMREKDELAEALVAIEKKAKLAVMKDRVGENEISDSPLTSNDRSDEKDVSEINKMIYATKETKEEEEEKDVPPDTGLGVWESVPSYDTPDTEIDPSELPTTEDYVVKEKTYEVKTCAVIESLDVETDIKPTGFKKRRAKNLRKKTDG
ncbi:hypothetical protein ACHWQZ_G014639 [Mnemiopsis leidyi]